MALRTRGGAIGAFEDGIGFVDLDGGTIEIFGDPKAGSPVNFNDGKCDRRGRFWTGTMAKDWSSPDRWAVSRRTVAKDHADGR